MRLLPSTVLAAALLFSAASHAGFVPHRAPSAQPPPSSSAAAKVKHGAAAVAGAVQRAGRHTQLAFRRLTAAHPPGTGRYMQPPAGDRPTFH